MSILVKGTNKPDSCRYCDFRHMSLTQNAFCTATHETIDYMDERTKRLGNCPIVEIPDHVHLVDIDEVYRGLTEYYHHSTETQHTALREALSRVPIIAEGEDK